MTTTSFLRLAKGIMVAISIVALPYASILSHGDEHEDEEGDSTQVEEAALDDNSGAVQDSIYAVINENYQTVRHIFEKSCFDCHSTFTSYPWYYEIPGIKGLIDDDIKEATGHFDLSKDFPFISKHDQADLLGDIKEKIEEDEMPLLSYRMMHWGRLIEDARRDSVFEWIDASLALLNKPK